MSVSADRKAIVELHSAVILFGGAGTFGKLLDVSPMLISAARTAIAAAALYAILRIGGVAMRLSKERHGSKVAIIGVLLAAHWVTFFYSIQLSTVAIGLVGIATYPVFVALLEPLVSKRPPAPFDLISASLVFLGLLIVAPTVSLSDLTTSALALSTLSGFLFAVVTLINRSLVDDLDYRVVAFCQHAVAALVLLPFAAFDASALIETRVGLLLLCLGLLFTALPHTLLLKSLKRLKALYVGLASALEPVYGIALAALILREIPAPRTALGAAIVVTTVAFYSWRHALDARSSYGVPH